jgi:hypothetical protein
VNGVSTRKVDRLVEQLGIHGMSKDPVSVLCRQLDEHVEAFRQRDLTGAYPYLWLDAKHVKVRSAAAMSVPRRSWSPTVSARQGCAWWPRHRRGVDGAALRAPVDPARRSADQNRRPILDR